jgi:hypothetical protein
MSRKQEPRSAGMRPSASAEGSLRSNGAPTGLPLAGSVASFRHATRSDLFHFKEEAA